MVWPCLQEYRREMLFLKLLQSWVGSIVPKLGKKQESLEEMSSSKSPHSTTPSSKLEVRHRQVKAEAAPFTGHLHACLQPTQHSCRTAFPITAALMLPNLPISLFSLFYTQPVLSYCTARNSTTELACTWHWFGNLHLQPPHHTLLCTSAAALKQIRGWRAETKPAHYSSRSSTTLPAAFLLLCILPLCLHPHCVQSLQQGHQPCAAHWATARCFEQAPPPSYNPPHTARAEALGLPRNSSCCS